jgi:glycosyltransferase involved in cell wall biosynthesis
MVTDEDLEEQSLMEGLGWRVPPSREVAGSPGAYRRYIRSSRGEFACAKRSCMEFQNAWVSDRTLCYLASGKPAVVQHTGASRYLPDAEGLFRFRTIEEAAEALAAVNSDYERHCRAARALAETHFDAKQVTARILEAAL